MKILISRRFSFCESAFFAKNRIAGTDHWLLWSFELCFSSGCTKWNRAASKILKLFMAGLFVVFLVKKCAACQSHRKSDFGWIAFTHFPFLNAYYKESSKKSQAILMAFRSCILTGKPELFFFLWFPKVERSFCAKFMYKTMIWPKVASGLT